MTSPMASPLATICATCRFRMSRTAVKSSWTQYGKAQVRGKKKNAKAVTSIDVRLNKDMAGYGRKGSIVPVPIGQMRNYFYPKRFADYVTWSEGRELKKAGYVPQRDFSFGKQSEDNEGAEIKDIQTTLIDQPARATRRSQPIRVDLSMMQPQEAFDAIDRILPPTVNFYRAPIDQNEATRSGKALQPTTSTPATPGPSTSLYPDATTGIYGSVTVADVATNLKALIAANEETGGRVVISEEDVRFTSGTDDEIRAKQLGDYDIEIKVKGVAGSIRRKVRVLAEEDAPLNIEAGNQAVNELAAQQPLAGDIPEVVLRQDAETGATLEKVDDFVEDTRLFMEEMKLEAEQKRMTPAEAAERIEFGDAIPDGIEREGVTLEGDDGRGPPRPHLEESDIRRS